MSPSTITPAVGMRTLSERSRPTSSSLPFTHPEITGTRGGTKRLRQVYLPDGSAPHSVCGLAAYGAHAGSRHAGGEQRRHWKQRLGCRITGCRPVGNPDYGPSNLAEAIGSIADLEYRTNQAE